MKPDFNQYAENFVQAKFAVGRKQSTLSFYRRTLADFERFVPCWPPTVENLRDFLGYKRSYCKEVTVNSVYVGVRSFLNWCEREKLFNEDENPLNRLDKPRNRRRLPKPVSVETMKKLFTTIERTPGDLANRDLAMFRLAYDTGARVTELANLLRTDLDVGGIMIRDGKGGNDRKVYFGRKCHKTLAAWLDIHPGDKHLFLNRLGEPLTRSGIYQALQKYCRLARIKMTVHQIRHSYATHAIRRGIDLGHVQNQMGHADISTTAIYLAVEDEERRQAHWNRSPGDIV